MLIRSREEDLGEPAGGTRSQCVSTGSWPCHLEPMASLLSFLVCSNQTHFFKN